MLKADWLMIDSQITWMGLNFGAEPLNIKVPPLLPRLNISIQELEWAYKQRFERNTHIDLRSISRIKFELESLLQDLTRPWKNILAWIFQGRYNIFQSLWGGGHRFTPTVNHVFFWLLELKCRSSKKQGWVGRPPAASLLGSHADVLGGGAFQLHCRIAWGA